MYQSSPAGQCTEEIMYVIIGWYNIQFW